MTFSTYADLQSGITNWLGGRTDLTTYYPDWITLFEAVAARKLRVRPMLTSTNLTTSSGAVAVPSDYLATSFVESISSGRHILLEQLPAELLVSYYPTVPSGTPASYSIVAGTLAIRPYDDANLAVVFHYYAKNSALSSALNWLFSNYPDVYLWGALAESGGFVRDDTALMGWKARRDEIFDEIKMVNFRERVGMTVRPLSYTP